MRLRQAPLRRADQSRPSCLPIRKRRQRIAATLTEITDENLSNALARLGAAIKQS